MTNSGEDALTAVPASAGEPDLELRVQLADDHLRRLTAPVPANQRFPGLDEGYEAADEDNESDDDEDSDDSETLEFQGSSKKSKELKKKLKPSEEQQQLVKGDQEPLRFLPNGSLFPAGRVRPELLKMTPLTPSKNGIFANLRAQKGLLSQTSKLGKVYDANLSNVANKPLAKAVDQTKDENTTSGDVLPTHLNSGVENDEIQNVHSQNKSVPQNEKIEEHTENTLEENENLIDSTMEGSFENRANDTDSFSEEEEEEEEEIAASWEEVDLESEPKQVLDYVQSEDWPVLLVDMTPWVKAGASIEQSRHECFEELLRAEEQLDQLCEAMFDVGAFHHSTENCILSDIKRLERLNPGKQFAPVNYPEVVHVADLYETMKTQDLWREIVRRADAGKPNDACTLLKGRVRDCSRSLAWKRSILEEIDAIASREEIIKLERDEINERVEALENLVKELEELWATTDDLDDFTTNCSMELQTVKSHLVDARKERSVFEAVEGSVKDKEGEKSVVDMILSMVLQRSVLCLPDMKHVGRIHQLLLAKWKSQFGRLPYLVHSQDEEARQQEKLKHAREDILWNRALNLNDDDMPAAPPRGSYEEDLDALVAWIEGKEPESEQGVSRRNRRQSKPKQRRSPSPPANKYVAAKLEESEDELEEEDVAKIPSQKVSSKNTKRSQKTTLEDEEAEEENLVELPVIEFEEMQGDEEEPISALLKRLDPFSDEGEPLVILDVSSTIWHFLALTEPYFHVLVQNPIPLPLPATQRILDAAFSFVAPESEEPLDSLAASLLNKEALFARSDEDIEEAVNELLAQFAIRVQQVKDATSDLDHVDVIVAPRCPTAALACALAHHAIENGKLFAISVDTFHEDYVGDDTWSSSIWPDLVDAYPMDTPSGLTHNFT